MQVAALQRLVETRANHVRRPGDTELDDLRVGDLAVAVPARAEAGRLRTRQPSCVDRLYFSIEIKYM